MSILDRAAEAAEEARKALRDRRKAADEQRERHTLSGQDIYEARLAAEEARRQAARDAIHQASLGREDQRWAQIRILRTLRDQISSERQSLIAALHAAVERGDLEDALAAQSRLAVLNPVDAVAVQRLMANGVEK